MSLECAATPYRPTLRLLHMSHVSEVGHIHLRATHEYRTTFEFLDLVFEDWREARVAVYKLWNGMTHLLCLDPIEVEVVALGVGESGGGEVVIDAPLVASVGEAGDVWQHALDDLDVDGPSLASEATQCAPHMFLLSTHVIGFFR